MPCRPMPNFTPSKKLCFVTSISPVSYTHLSSGNILREAIRNRTETGLKAKAFMDQGNLVPDEVIIGIVRDRLAEPDCANGYIRCV